MQFFFYFIFINCLCYGVIFYERKRVSPKAGIEAGESVLLFLEEVLLKQEMNACKISLPEYKFYTSLFFCLLEFHFRWGIPWRENLVELKEALYVDLRYERKVSKKKQTVIMQIILISLFSWLLALWGAWQLGQALELRTIAFFILWQFLGLVILLVGISVLRKKIFKEFEQLMGRFVTVKIYLRVGASLGDVWEKSAIEALSKSLRQRQAKLIFNQILMMLESIRQGGGRGEDQCRDIAKQLMDYQEARFISFEGAAGALFLLVMAVFFMGSYLGLLLSFLQNLFH